MRNWHILRITAIDIGENEWCSEDDVFNCPSFITHRKTAKNNDFVEVSQD